MRKIINIVSIAVILTGSMYLTTAPPAMAVSNSEIISECDCKRSSCSGKTCKCKWHGGCEADSR